MKKLFLLAAALMALAACKKETPEPEPVKPDSISVSPGSRTVGGDGADVTVTVTSSGEWTLAASDGASYDWVSPDKTSGSNGDRVIFEVDPNTDAERTAAFVFTCGTATADFKIISTPGEVVIPEIEVTSANPVELESGSGTFQVILSVSEDVEYTGLGATIQQKGEWLSYTGSEAGSSAGTAVMSFSYSANEVQEAREATVTISYPNADPATVTVSQKGKTEEGGGDDGDYLITTAAYMKSHYASPLQWNNSDVMKFGNTITVEMLVKHDAEFVRDEGNSRQWQSDWVGTMMGIEGRFLIRHGDNTSNYQEWELIYADNSNSEIKVKSTKDIPADEWVHIAVVLDGAAKTVTLYQDGEPAGSAAMGDDVKDIDLTETYTNSWQQNVVQKFCIGRSYDNTRDFCGMMSEVRLWNRALAADEINAENHFYTVDPASEGLVAYWKFNDGDGSVIKDYTSNGNDLTGYVLDESQWNNYQGEDHWSEDMVWVDVQLPAAE